jgi:hypothetical protein
MCWNKITMCYFFKFISRAPVPLWPVTALTFVESVLFVWRPKARERVLWSPLAPSVGWPFLLVSLVSGQAGERTQLYFWKDFLEEVHFHIQEKRVPGFTYVTYGAIEPLDSSSGSRRTSHTQMDAWEVYFSTPQMWGPLTSPLREGWRVSMRSLNEGQKEGKHSTSQNEGQNGVFTFWYLHPPFRDFHQNQFP